MVSFTSSPAGDRRRRSVWSIPAGFLFLDLLLIVLHAAFGDSFILMSADG